MVPYEFCRFADFADLFNLLMTVEITGKDTQIIKSPVY